MDISTENIIAFLDHAGVRHEPVNEKSLDSFSFESLVRSIQSGRTVVKTSLGQLVISTSIAWIKILHKGKLLGRIKFVPNIGTVTLYKAADLSVEVLPGEDPISAAIRCVRASLRMSETTDFETVLAKAEKSVYTPGNMPDVRAEDNTYWLQCELSDDLYQPKGYKVTDVFGTTHYEWLP